MKQNKTKLYKSMVQTNTTVNISNNDPYWSAIKVIIVTGRHSGGVFPLMWILFIHHQSEGVVQNTGSNSS